MCVRVIAVDVQPAVAAWDSDDVTIYVRRGVGSGAAYREVRAILADLHPSLPDRQGVLTCFCGDAIALPAELTGSRRPLDHDRQHAWQVSRGA